MKKPRLHPLVWLPLSTLMAVPTIVFEMTLIHACMGWRPERYARYGGGLVGAVSIAAICMVFIYQSPWWRARLARNVTAVNFAVFAAVNLALAFADYFAELWLLVFLTNVTEEQAQMGVVLHQQLVFFTQSFNTNWFFGHRVIGGNAFSQMFVWYLVSWLAWLPFGVPVMRGTSFTDEALPNVYLLVMGAIASLNFVNLSKLNIGKYFSYQTFANSPMDQIGVVGCISVLGAAAQYAVVHYLTLWLMGPHPSRQMFGSAVSNNISVCWISQAIVGETVGAWLHPLLRSSAAKLAAYLGVCFALSFVLLVPLYYLYHELVFKVFMVRVLGQTDFGVFARQDYQFGFGVGNLYLVWNGLKFFSRTSQRRLTAEAAGTRPE